jgi:hypothetical protein
VFVLLLLWPIAKGVIENRGNPAKHRLIYRASPIILGIWLEGAIIKGQEAVTLEVQASYKIAKGIT